MIGLQVRAEATRRLILDAAVGLFAKVGYANSSLAELIAATGVSKGAFYYHFENREAVTAAIIAEADAMLTETAVGILSDPSSRALGNLIRAIFVIADLEQNDPKLRVGVQLRGGLSQISSNLDGFNSHRELFTNVIATGISEGDIRADVDVDQLGHTLWAAVLGTHQHCGATGEDLRSRLGEVMSVLLPAICTPEAAREYSGVVKDLAAGSAPLRR